MSFWSKFANIATGGLAGGLKHGVLNAATGGLSELFPGQHNGQGAPQLPGVSPEAQAYLDQQSPEDQAKIRQSWGTGNNAETWYQAAKAAGSVPPAAPAPAPTPTPSPFDYEAVKAARGTAYARAAQQAAGIPTPTRPAMPAAPAAPIGGRMGLSPRRRPGGSPMPGGFLLNEE